MRTQKIYDSRDVFSEQLYDNVYRLGFLLKSSDQPGGAVVGIEGNICLYL